MSVLLRKNGSGAIFSFYPLDLSYNQVQRFLPGNTNVFAAPAALRVPISSGIPILSFKRIKNPVGRIDALFISQSVGGHKRFHGWFKSAAAGLDFPGLKGPGIIFPIENGEVES